MRRLTASLFFLLCLLCAPAWAELRVIVTPNETADVAQIDSVGEFNSDRSPVRVKSIDSRVFEAKPATLDEVLEEYAGISVRRSGGVGGFSTVSIRGSSSQQVLVLIDGMPINDASTGTVDLSHFSLSQFEKIEVFKGALPVEYGLASVGGAINLVTKKSANIAAVTLGLGSFGTKKGGVTGGKTYDAWRYQIVASQLFSDNDYSVTRDANTPLNPDDDFKDFRHNNELNQSDALITLSHLGEESVVDLGFNYSDRNKNLPAINGRDGVETRLDTERFRYNLGYKKKQEQFEYALETRYEQRNEIYDDSDGSLGISQKVLNEADVAIHSLRGFAAVTRGPFQVSLNTSYAKEGFNSRNLLLTPFDTCDPFVNCDIQFNREKYSLTLGGRFDYERWLIEANISDLHINDKNESNDSVIKGSDNYLNYQISSKYRIISLWTLGVSIAQAVRAPNSYELFGDRGYQVGSSDLQAEESLNAELSLEYASGRKKLFVTYFNRDVDNLIVPFADSRGVLRYLNTSKARIEGLELEASYPIFEFAKIGYEGTVFNSQVQSITPAFDNKKIAGTYHDIHRFYLNAYLGFWRGEASYRFADNFFYERANSVEARLKRSLDFSLGYRRASYTWVLEVKNTLNNKFSDFDRVPNPGRSFFSTFKYSF